MILSRPAGRATGGRTIKGTSDRAGGLGELVSQQAIKRNAARVPSVPGLGDDRRRTPDARQELAELRLKVFVAAADQELDVLDDLQDRAAQLEGLGRDLRPVTVVNAIVAALEDHPVTVLHLLPRLIPSRVFVRRTQCGVGGAGDPE